MGRCTGCGREDSSFVGGYLCPICKKKQEMEKAESSSTAGVATGYRTRTNSWQTNAKIHKGGFGTVIVVFILVIVAGFLGLRYWNYTSFEDGLDNEFAIDEEISSDSTSFINGILESNDDYEQWTFSITKMPNDYVSSIFDFISEKTVRIKHWTEDGIDSYYYYFYSGFDMGTGLTGKYYLTTIDGTKCIIYKNDEVVYQEGSDFYNEHYEQLMEMTYDAVVPGLTEKLVGGEYGTNEDFGTTVLKKDSIFASVENDSDYTKIIDESNNERYCYVLYFSQKASEEIPDISDYIIVEE